MTRPPLVLVSGMPGAGKTTLATHLAERLFLPLVAKDAVKESLSRTHGVPPDRASSMPLGIRAIELVHELASLHLERGAGLVVEAAFVRGLSEPELRPRIERSVAVGVHCVAPVDVVRARFAARSGAPERHPCHPDAEILAEGVDHWPERYGRLELGVPWLEVDTTAGYDPSLDAIVGWVEDRIRC